MSDQDEPIERLTKRNVIDHPREGTANPFLPGTPDKELIADELESIRELAQESKGDLEVPWGNSLQLDEDDWVLRQIFQTAGLNPRRAGHWRLLLGIFAEFQVDPNQPDILQRHHTADAISSTRWTPGEREELLKQASQLATEHPKWSRKRICEELAKLKRWVRTGVAWEGQRNEPRTILRILEEEISQSRESLKDGFYGDDTVEKQRVIDRLKPFRAKKLRPI